MDNEKKVARVKKSLNKVSSKMIALSLAQSVMFNEGRSPFVQLPNRSQFLSKGPATPAKKKKRKAVAKSRKNNRKKK